MVYYDLNPINDGMEFESNHCNIYSEELELGKENTDKNETSFLGLEIKIRDRVFKVGLLEKRYSFSFYIVRMPSKSSTVSSSIFFSAIDAESLRIA